MSIREMIETHPQPNNIDRDTLVQCIDACFACVATCTSCANDLLSKLG